MSITAGDLGLRVNRVHGQFSGAVRCLNAILHKCCQELHKLRSKMFDEEVYWCFLSPPLGKQRVHSGEWTYYPPFLQENIAFRINGEWICSQSLLKPVQGLWEIMQIKQVCKDVFRIFNAFLSFGKKYHMRSVSFSLNWDDTCVV